MNKSSTKGFDNTNNNLQSSTTFQNKDHPDSPYLLK